jgi:glucose/arabinose dehydrogenase
MRPSFIRSVWQIRPWALVAPVSLCVASYATAQTPAVQSQRVASGLSAPIAVTAPAGDPNRLFIAEQGSGGSAQIKILDLTTNTVRPTPFLNVTGLTHAGSEQGLLGLAFHPDYATNGKFYVNVTAPGGAFGNGITQIREYTVSAANPNVANPAARTLLQFDQPQTNHNGGWIAFSPRPGDAGNLYIGSGDGGAGNDTGTGHNPTIGNGQDRNTLLGKILRINVDRDDFPTDANRNYGIPANNPYAGATAGADEIFNIGLRNPYRAGFDRVTGNLFIGDVGQGTREEVDFQPASNPGGGENYGWRIREGRVATPGISDPAPVGPLTEPIHDYPHGGGATVISGSVYRAGDIPGLDGTYFFADFIQSRIWSLRFDGTTITEFTERTNELRPSGGLTINNISSFGEDAVGRMYIVDIGGEVFRIVPEPSAAALLAIAGAALLRRRRRSRN